MRAHELREKELLVGRRAANIIDRRGLLGHGAGHVVWWVAGEWDVPVVEAARRLAAGEGWDVALAKWGGTA